MWERHHLQLPLCRWFDQLFNLPNRSGVCAYYAGFWAPICIFFVSFVVLYLYRNIYEYVVTALPYNGGAYTVLLNTTVRPVAVCAGLLTCMSYIATAVVSAVVAVSYCRHLLPWADEYLFTVFILWVFAALNYVGLKDSANVAVLIFVFHLGVLGLLIGDCVLSVLQGGTAVFWHNYEHRFVGHHRSLPIVGQSIQDFYSRYDALPNGQAPPSLLTALSFGFASAMLGGSSLESILLIVGITGFETSANFVEEQRPGVFPCTLRNMWIAVAVLNPTISLLSLFRLPLPTVMGFPLDYVRFGECLSHASSGSPTTTTSLGSWRPTPGCATL